MRDERPCERCGKSMWTHEVTGERRCSDSYCALWQEMRLLAFARKFKVIITKAPPCSPPNLSEHGLYIIDYPDLLRT